MSVCPTQMLSLRNWCTLPCERVSGGRIYSARARRTMLSPVLVIITLPRQSAAISIGLYGFGALRTGGHAVAAVAAPPNVEPRAVALPYLKALLWGDVAGAMRLILHVQ